MTMTVKALIEELQAMPAHWVVNHVAYVEQGNGDVLLFSEMGDELVPDSRVPGLYSGEDEDEGE
ncbi:hypothetical protein [Chitinolyticbacter meiyuanensis]|uniref:hypothetical protein n=1 Tax=Chitinolyticbacter meiyuanensis TaxID=682798 RepID=UPI0011E5CF8C|nr:hypothetical protein [Chitinolyticbacter meiyuanensis]